MNYQTLLYLIFFSFLIVPAKNLDAQEAVDIKLEELAKEIKGLNEQIEISVNGVSIQEFLRGIATNAEINVDVDPSLNIKIVNNFSGVKVSDVFIFLAKQYNLEISNIGSIITIKGREKPKETKIKDIDVITIKYDSENDLLSYELVNDTLWKVLREITRISGKNVVIPSNLNNKIVNGYIQNMPFSNVIEKLALTNNLSLEKTPDNFYFLNEKSADIKSKGETGNSKRNENSKNTSSNNDEGYAELNIRSFESFDVFSENTEINWLLKKVADTLGVNYVMLNQVEGVKNLSLNNIDFESFLLQLFAGTKYMFKKVDHVYFIGDIDEFSLINTKVIQLQFRSVDKIIDYIPEELKKDISLKEFAELNSIVITGTTNRIELIESFLKEIDKVVPVILIEVMIVDYKKNHTVTTGISAGTGTPSTTSAQTIFPGIDYKLSTESINKILGKFESFGWFNLGKVTPDFYLSIKALESNGIVKIRSTPKLSTLNGHEANMSSGETKYYKEEKSNYYGTQNPSLANSYTWNPVTADLAITITPFVSGDDQITLEVEVTQSEFTTREFDEAPPGSVTRKFKSLIRMKDGETVLLGGLEKERSENTGSGWPLLSRIPVIKWFFSSKTKSNEDSRLNIFIQPTIIF